MTARTLRGVRSGVTFEADEAIASGLVDSGVARYVDTPDTEEKPAEEKPKPRRPGRPRKQPESDEK
jgi:hypothetical protein